MYKIFRVIPFFGSSHPLRFCSAHHLAPPTVWSLLRNNWEKGKCYIQPRNKMNWKSITKPCKKLLISSGGASSGRNNAGRITTWHRGGGSKRLHRNVDLKRNTSSVGIVERLEYDPNRSSKIALVRWTEGVQPNKSKEHFIPSHKLVRGPLEHRCKRKAAVSWRSLGGPDMTFDFVNADEDNEKQGCLHLKPTGQAPKDDRAPISYILASHEMEVGQMVMNYDASIPSSKQTAF